MPDIQSGLSEGFPDVNSEEGFLSALASKVDAEVPEETLAALRDSDTTVAAGLTTGNEPSPQSAEEPVAEEGETEPVVPDESGQTAEQEGESALAEGVQEYISKHGGTPEQAIAALYDELQNAQQLIGRQSASVAENRQLHERIEALEEMFQQPGETFDAPIPTGVSEELENFFEEKGPVQAMNWLVENRPDLIEDGIEVWKGYDETAATRFATRYDRFLDEETAKASAPQAPQTGEDPFLTQMKEQAAFTQAVETARAASGFSEEEWASVQQHVVPALEDPSTSVLIKEAVANGSDPARQVEGMKALFQIAQSRAASEATTKATEQVKTQQREAQAAAKKQAQVATGSLTPPQKGQSGDEEGDDREERITRFKQSLLDAETTDVSAGLTFGPQR